MVTVSTSAVSAPAGHRAVLHHIVDPLRKTMTNRRTFFATAIAGLSARALAGQEAAQRATRAMPTPKIKDVQVIATAPAGLRLTVVKVTTDQDGLYGYGCGTFTQRAEMVNVAVDRYLRPFLIGKPADRIDDLWQAMYNSS